MILILVDEDASSMMRALSYALELEGIAVRYAHSSDDALAEIQAAQGTDFAALIDVMLAGSHGLETDGLFGGITLARIIRSENPEVRLGFMTNSSSSSFIRHVERASRELEMPLLRKADGLRLVDQIRRLLVSPASDEG